MFVLTTSVFGANDGSEDASSSTPFADGAGAFGPVFGAWSLKTSSGSGSENGFFSGSSTNNGFGGGPGIDSVFHVGGPNGPLTNIAWGVYANNGQTAVAYRPFSGGSLAPGQAFEISLDNGFVSSNTSSYVGLILRTGNVTTNKNEGQRFEFLFAGGETTYKFIDATGVHDTGLGFTSGGFSVRVTLVGEDKYQLRVIINGDLTPHVYSGTLSGTAGAGIDSFAVYNQNAGNGPAYNLFLNNLLVSTGPLPSITSIEVGSISFQSFTGAAHEIQTRDDLTAGGWGTLTNVTGSGGIMQVIDPTTSSQSNRFYRLKTTY